MNLIGQLMSLGVCIVLITDKHENLRKFNDNIRQNIPSRIKLSAYTVDQAFYILKDRAEHALVNGSYSDTILNSIASQTNGNMALAISMLKIAALRAEQNHKHTIDEADIPIPNDLSMKLSHDEAAILNILREKKSLPSSLTYQFYTQEVKYPKGPRSFRNYMERLCSKGLVKASGEKRGRIYEVTKAYS
jgi:Cdc6-like AAA superfamily ATPase